MMHTEMQEQELRSIIEQSVDDSVARAFKKYGKYSRFVGLPLKGVLSLLITLAILGGVGIYTRTESGK